MIITLCMYRDKKVVSLATNFPIYFFLYLACKLVI